MNDQMNLSVDQKTMQQLVSAAILQTLGTEKRDQLLQNAIYSSLGDGSRSDLQRMFNSEVELYAREAIRQFLKDNEVFKIKLAELLNKAMIKAISSDDSELVNALAKALVQAWAPKY